MLKLKNIVILGIVFSAVLLSSLSLYAQTNQNRNHLQERLRILREKWQTHPIEDQISPNIKMFMPGGAFPVWSEVTNKITFTKKVKDRYEVFVADPDGSNEKCLTCDKPQLNKCGNRGQSFWHKSGKYIVFSAENSTYKRLGLGVSARPGLGRNFNVWIMTVDGENFWQMTDYPENWGVIETKFSNDGTKIYWNEEFSMEKYPQGKPEDPTPHPGYYWNKDAIKYRKGEEIGAWRIVYADIDFSGGVPKMTNVVKLEPPAGFTMIEANGFTPDDKGLICDLDNLAETKGMCFWGEIYVYDIQSKSWTRLTNTPWKYNEDPSYSKDGKKIVYKEATKNKGMPEDGMEIFIMDPDGKNKTQLTHFSDPGAAEYRSDWMQIAEFDWSPDGRKIIFGMARGDKKAPKVDINSDLYILDLSLVE